jgi:two-component system, NtrC family, response regulator AtoC
MSHILIVDDDDNSAQMLATLVAAEGHTCAIAGTLSDARDQMLLRHPQVILLDLKLPDGSGLDLFEEPQLRGDAEIVMITGHASMDTSVQALRLGASDYITKPVNVAHLKRVLGRLGQSTEVRTEISDLQAELERTGRFGRLLGQSAPMLNVYKQLVRVAPTAVGVLIVGESGTGKEVVAQTIHDLSRRRRQPFLAVNCGAISPQLIESELFGHEKGSFTGAMRQHRGYFERAHGGTLFLDEVTEMPLELQVKLLRVLETGAFLRVGSDDLIETDVRIIAATNRNPAEAVERGKLREDLYYRLNVFRIMLPPLRERLEDIDLIAPYFLSQVNGSEARGARTFGAKALAQLRQYHWPGNVRELRNVIQRTAIMSDEAVINEISLPDEINPTSPPIAQPQAQSADGHPVRIVIAPGMSIAEAERLLIHATLEHCEGAKERTADLLGISLKTLYNRLREYETPPSVSTSGLASADGAE